MVSRYLVIGEIYPVLLLILSVDYIDRDTDFRVSDYQKNLERF